MFRSFGWLRDWFIGGWRKQIDDHEENQKRKKSLYKKRGRSTEQAQAYVQPPPVRREQHK